MFTGEGKRTGAGKDTRIVVSSVDPKPAAALPSVGQIAIPVCSAISPIDWVRSEQGCTEVVAVSHGPVLPRRPFRRSPVDVLPSGTGLPVSAFDHPAAVDRADVIIVPDYRCSLVDRWTKFRLIHPQGR